VDGRATLATERRLWPAEWACAQPADAPTGLGGGRWGRIGNRAQPWTGIAIDGKAVRGSRQDGQAALHVLNVFSQRLGVVLGQRAVADKTNEIPEIRPLLEGLVLEGRLVTVDALHTQRETAQLIVKKKGRT